MCWRVTTNPNSSTTNKGQAIAIIAIEVRKIDRGLKSEHQIKAFFPNELDLA